MAKGADNALDCEVTQSFGLVCEPTVTPHSMEYNVVHLQNVM